MQHYHPAPTRSETLPPPRQFSPNLLGDYNSHPTWGHSPASQGVPGVDAPRSQTPVALLDSPSFDPTLPPAATTVPHSPSPAAASPTSEFDGNGAPIRTASGRSRGPPMRSTTMDDQFYAGAGEPSAYSRGKVPATYHHQQPLERMDEQGGNGQWGAIGQGYTPPSSRGPSMYAQGNHSSPSLAQPESSEPVPPLPTGAGDAFPSFPAYINDLPAMPTTMDDLNIGIENMRFEQRTSGENPYAREAQQQYYAEQQQQQQQQQQLRRYSPNDIALPTGPDGAMQIRGRGDNGQTASVYSTDSAGHDGRGSIGSRMGWQQQHGRAGSASSNRTFGGQGGYPEQGRGGGGVDGYSEAEQRPGSSASFLPYDDPYGGVAPQQGQQQQQQYGDYAGQPGPSSAGGQGYFPPPGGPQQGHNGGYYGQPPPSNVEGYGGFPQQGAYGQQPPSQQGFQTQPQHAAYGYDYRAAAAAQNPYYAAATGQLGLDPSSASQGGGGSPYGQLHRGASSVSSLGLVPPGQGSSNSLARSQSSLNIPGGPMRRKATGASTLSTLSSASGSSGPPITKASVDEYRQRIKADPDPEAQFNFAKYLIEAAKKINSSASGDEKGAKKYRDALLAESLKLIKRLATQGSGLGKPAYADAQFFLANCLGNGSLGLQVDHEKAYNLYVQASKQNHSAATYRTAVCNELGAGTRRDHARAVLFYRKASALGDTAGMFKLGMILLHGLLGQQRNPKEALAWLKRAASQADDDNPHALHELGLLYEKPPALVSSTTASLGAKAAAQLQQQHLQAGGPPPTIVPFDPIQAREYFTQAAQLGYPPSQFKLGACYEFGTLTCPVDPRRSIAWYTRAAERGDSGAELALSGWYLTGSEGVLKQSDSEAYLWARRAANKGLAKAEYAVGYYSEVGIGVKAELEEAKRWYMRAAAQGNKRAMQRLTELKKLGADKRAPAGKGGKGGARPTRKDAETECIIS